MRRLFGALLVCLLAAAPALADWFEGDPYKMHWPQTPLWGGWDVEFGRERYLDSPYFDLAAIEWEIDQGMKLIGVDCAGIENLDSATHECHLAIFRRGIPLIENLTNLGALPGPRATVLAIPIAIKGLESFPVRVVALEDGGS